MSYDRTCQNSFRLASAVSNALFDPKLTKSSTLN